MCGAQQALTERAQIDPEQKFYNSIGNAGPLYALDRSLAALSRSRSNIHCAAEPKMRSRRRDTISATVF